MPDISGAGKLRDHAGQLAACLFISMTVTLLQPGCGRYAGMSGGQEKGTVTSEQTESVRNTTDAQAGDSAGQVEATTETAAAWSVRQLSYAMAPDEATGQAWMNSFQSMKSLEVVSIEQARLEEWTSE